VLDLKQIREDPDAVRDGLERRKVDPALLDRVIELDSRRRRLLPVLEEKRAAQNRASEQIARAKREGEDASSAIADMREVASDVKQMQAEVSDVERELNGAMVALPNLAAQTAAGDEDEVLREVGEGGRTGRDHVELLGRLVDTEAGARVAGSRFVYLRGPLVLLELALVRWVIDLLMEHGFEPVIPPVLVREHALYGTGFLPDTEQQIYQLPEDDLYLVGTSEVPLAALHAGEILDAAELPLRYAGYSPCFRREAGAAGKDTRGMFRVHQFDKVEMFSFVDPAESEAEHERLLAIEEQIMQSLDIPYRVVNIAAWDLGSSAAKKYDIEAWLPGEGRYRELTSTSNTTDFQARRLDARYRPAEGGSPRPVHTLNGTAVAVGRTIIAIVENGQREDGSIRIPEVLHAYGAPKVIEAQSPVR
jgi:seryl-tRNA synthetase